MNTPVPPARYPTHRGPAAISRHGVGLSDRFALGSREVTALLFARGGIVSSDAIRKWCRKFGPQDAKQSGRRRSPPGDKGHLEEAFLPIHGARHSLGRAGDQDGKILDMLGQRRRDKTAAKTFFRKLLQDFTSGPRVLITDKRRCRLGVRCCR
jgi:putative transposase